MPPRSGYTTKANILNKQDNNTRIVPIQTSNNYPFKNLLIQSICSSRIANSSSLTGILVATNEPHPTQSKTADYRPRNQATVIPEKGKKHKKPELQADSKKVPV